METKVTTCLSADEARSLGEKVLAEAFHVPASTSAEEKASDGREGWPSKECPRSGRGREDCGSPAPR